MVASVAVLIGASLVLILLLEYPFSGTVAVRPAPFENVATDLRPASGASISRSEFSSADPAFRSVRSFPG